MTNAHTCRIELCLHMTLVFGKYFYLPIGEVIVTSAVFSCGWKPYKFFFPETLQEAGDYPAHMRKG